MNDFEELLLVAATFLTVGAVCSVKFLRSNERAVVMRLGGLMSDFSQPLGPGFHLVWWPIDKLIRWNICTGEEQIIGAEGEARDMLGDGRAVLVSIAGKDWMATSREPIALGQNVRVVGFDGPKLQVALESHPRSEKEIRDEKIAAIRKLMKSNPRSAFLHWDLATLYEANGDSQAASEEYQKAEKLNPNIRADREKRITEINDGKASRKDWE
jgi:hypothetical protein